MQINIIDYRGDDTIINSRGDTLFQYRTKYYLRQQQDWHRWQAQGHTFTVFTQHQDDCHTHADEVIPIPRMRGAEAKNVILEHMMHAKDEWFGMWDNDATLYWNRLKSTHIPQDLMAICDKAKAQGIHAWVPFNPQAAPYQPTELDDYTFRATIQMKGTMTFMQNPNRYGNQRFNETITTQDDLEWAIQLTRKGLKCGLLQQASLRELVNGKSTIFRVNAYHKAYKKPGKNANPKGLLQWDAQLDRREKYEIAQREIAQLYGTHWRDWQRKQRQLWHSDNTQFNRLFVE